LEVGEARIEQLLREAKQAWAIEQTQPPTPFYLNKDDQLFVYCAGSLSGVRLGLRARLLMMDGKIQTYHEEIYPSSDRSFGAKLLSLPECFLLSLVLQTLGTTEVRRGHVWARVGVQRPPDPAGESKSFVLCQGYVERQKHLAFPPGIQESSISGPGLIRLVTSTNPAAGSNPTLAVPTNARWRFIQGRVKLVTSAATGTRRVWCTITDGTNWVEYSPALETQAPSLTRYYVFTNRPVAQPTGTAFIQIPIATDIILAQGWVIGTYTDAFDPGDDYDPLYIWVEEWIED